MRSVFVSSKREWSAEEDRGGPDAGHRDAEGGRPGKLLSPERKRKAARHLVTQLAASERRACKVVEQHRSTQRYRAMEGHDEQELVQAVLGFARRHPRYGYRRIKALLA